MRFRLWEPFSVPIPHRPWWVLWLFAGGIITVVLVYGWVAHSGDVSYGRLEAIPVPEHFSWVYCVPPFVLLLLTRWGVPVSTTFLTLTIFAPKALESMLLKSLLGYATAFVVAIVVYKLVTRSLESRFNRTEGLMSPWWVVAQWCSTGFLWSQWLIQDLANIYVFLPRDPVSRTPDLAVGWFIASIAIILGLLAFIFYNHGGTIQKVVADEDEHHRHPLGDVCGLDLRDRAVCVQGAQPHSDEHDLGIRRSVSWTRDRHRLEREAPQPSGGVPAGAIRFGEDSRWPPRQRRPRLAVA